MKDQLLGSSYLLAFVSRLYHTDFSAKLYLQNPEKVFGLVFFFYSSVKISS